MSFLENKVAISKYRAQLELAVRRLRRALKPFAEIGLVRDRDKAGNDMIDAPDLKITPKHVRTARRALG